MEERIKRIATGICYYGFNFCFNEGQKPTQEELQAAQDALAFIKDGDFNQAAIAAARTEASRRIYEAALKY